MTNQAGGIVVAIDGPAGSGKSSVAQAAARRLGFAFLDTGAAYRLIALHVLQSGGDTDDARQVLDSLDSLRSAVSSDAGVQRFSLDDVDVTDEIRTERVSAAVSGVARIPEVRSFVNDGFRTLVAAAAPGIVVEGRDITTVVAPDADVRVLLTADEQVRIQRRFGDVGGELAAVAERLSARDAKDVQVVDFMTAAPGVTTIDSTDLTFDETVQAVTGLVGAQEASHD